MTVTTYTTGQTSGITHIPGKTLQRYVRDFREFFSASAQKQTKGRRFTAQDIETILLIRRLYFERTKPERIRAALRGEWIPPAKPVYDALDALQLVEIARQDKQLSQEYSRQAKASANDARWTVQSAEITLDRFRKVIEQRDYFRDQVPVLMKHFEEMDERVKKLEERLKYSEQQKSGLFGLW